MTDTLLSPSWYRVAKLRPRLRRHARIHRHVYRHQVWYVLQDQCSGRHHRFSRTAHYIIGLMDGRRTVDDIWEAAAAHLGDDAPTQDETIRLLGQLHGADVLQCDVPPDAAELFERSQRHQRSQWKKRLANPMALRLPLLDPERVLARWLPLVRPFFGWGGLLVWLAAVVSAAVLAGAHWDELTQNVAGRALAPHNLLLLGLVFPLVKALHELGHAFATKVWGGEVHEMGIMFLVLMPIPYVDASAASAFPEKRRRMLVGAAGMMVELFVASVALFVWLNIEPGIARAVAYNIMLIAGVSTLVFNGNPLLRFDAYYILADAVGIPNLASRANRYLAYLVQRYLFGVREAESPASAPGERAWFFGYGVASFVYRLFILFVIILFIAAKFFVVGVALAIWGVATQVLWPVAKGIGFVMTSPRVGRQRLRAVATSATVLVVAFAVLFLLPVPLSTRAEGVVWLPEQAQVRAGTEGVVRHLLAESDRPVRQGDPLIECEDPFLQARVRVLESRLRELQARYAAERSTDRVQAEILKEELAAAQADLALARERADALLIRSPADGLFVVPDAQNLPGRFLKQGELVAYVLDPSARSARVVVPQRDIDLVRSHTRAVEVRLADRLRTILPASIQRGVPAATDRLPSRALGSAGGGTIAVDPTDADGTRVLQKVFQFDLELPSKRVGLHTGGRVHVRFDHGREPLAEQWYRKFRQLFLRQFNV